MHSRISGRVGLPGARTSATRSASAARSSPQLNWRKLGWSKRVPVEEPRYDPDELLGIASIDVRKPFDVREVIARIVDGSRFHEFKPTYGTTLVTGYAHVHGYPVGILANNGILFSESSQKGAQFIQLCNQTDTPILFLQNITGFMVGRRYEAGRHHQGRRQADQRGVEQHRAAPHGHDRRLVRRRQLRHVGPRLRSALRVRLAEPPHRGDGAASSSPACSRSCAARRPSAPAQPFDEAADATLRGRWSQEQIEKESYAFFATARLWDDGIIDPRDTRTVLGICLSAVHSNAIEGSDGGYGVFRM